MEIKELGGKFHKDCFKCCACSKPLAGVPFKAAAAPENAEGKAPYCKECHTEAFAPTCAGCGAKITGAGVRINNMPYHKECKPSPPPAVASAEGLAGPKAAGGIARKGGKAVTAKGGLSAPSPSRPSKRDMSMSGARDGVHGLGDLYSGLE